MARLEALAMVILPQIRIKVNHHVLKPQKNFFQVYRKISALEMPTLQDMD